MNREIKFRVRRADGTLIGYERFVKSHWECLTTWAIKEYEDAWENHWGHGTLAGDIREQWIWLQDKQKVDIYEGDVTKLNGYGKGDDILLVEYKEDGFYGLVTRDRGYSRKGMLYNGRFLSAGKVIGDKWANPELLK